MKASLLVIGAILAVFVGVIGLTFCDLGYKRFFKPKYENVNRAVFEETKSYNQGKIQELVKYHHEYKTSTDQETKSAILATVRISFADYDIDNVPVELQSFFRLAVYN